MRPNWAPSCPCPQTSGVGHGRVAAWLSVCLPPTRGQISDIQVSGQSEDMTAKEKLLLWSQRMVEGYQGLRCDNFTSSWRDGRLFNAIIHRHKYAAPGGKAGMGPWVGVSWGSSAGRLQTSRGREHGGRSVFR